MQFYGLKTMCFNIRVAVMCRLGYIPISELKVKYRFKLHADLVNEMDIETIAELQAVLKEIGYSSKAITAITEWYTKGRPLPN